MQPGLHFGRQKSSRLSSLTRGRARYQEIRFGYQEYTPQSLENFSMSRIAIRCTSNCGTERKVHHTNYCIYHGPKPLDWTCDSEAAPPMDRDSTARCPRQTLRRAARPRVAQTDLANGRRSDSLLCAGMTRRSARAITPTTTSTAVKATVSATGESVSRSDLYIVSPSIGRIPIGATVRERQGFIRAQTRLLWKVA